MGLGLGLGLDVVVVVVQDEMDLFAWLVGLGWRAWSVLLLRLFGFLFS